MAKLVHKLGKMRTNDKKLLETTSIAKKGALQVKTENVPTALGS